MKKYVLILVVLLGLFSILQAQTTIFFDSFENGTFDLSHWEPIPGPNNGIIEVFIDNTAPDQFFSVRIGKSRDAGGSNTNELRLYLDLSGHEQVALEFWIKDFFDETGPFDEIRFSDDSAATSVEVLQLDPGNWVNNEWGKLPPIDIDGLAADHNLTLNDKFVIIFSQLGTADFIGNFTNDRDGFYLDAVHVYDPEISYTPIPYSNGFESRALDNVFSWAFPSYPPPGTTLPEYVRPGGWVRVLEDATASEGNWVMSLGRRNDGNTTTNAVDLHLNLFGENQVALNFWIRDFFNEDHDEDGVFFSDNGGRTFVKVFDFLPTLWNNNFWGKFPPLDVDRLAQEYGISLTDSFVIRFQQRGVNDFIGNFSNDRDGLIFDLVEIYNPNTVYVDSFPFSDGFESEQLENMWKWSNPFYPDRTARDGELRIGGVVQVDQANPHSGFFNVSLGRRNDGDSTTNGLDLHLNLIGAKEANLTFWIADVFDENSPSDSLWFSNDGGENFTSILQFTPESWPNNVYQEIVVNISEAAALRNLELTERCIIRFQQNGVNDFSGNFSNDRDGFRIDDVLVTVDSITTAVNDESDLTLPNTFTLHQNYPNPFNPNTKIIFALPSTQRVTLKVFDLAGKEVATLLQNEQKTAGVHEVTFEAQTLPSAVYFYRIIAGDFAATRKMLLVQ